MQLTDTVANATQYTSGSVSWKDVEFEPSLSASVALGGNVDNGLLKINVSTAALTRPDLDGIKAFELTGVDLMKSFHSIHL